ncbi:SLAC1 anion channel family protein [Serinibacter salmoneus]|uniref:Tellurite resistance protein n=1 Tax=Serinibacter salmoneus TaxID=556530 RepID=A0A2A9CXM3_9MICO|nr:SLAC1 anion channel family protein [Serinibacter salmoneus]PFG19187.1 tellurite resistance protein [Serinibacter salmoneus]
MSATTASAVLPTAEPGAEPGAESAAEGAAAPAVEPRLKHVPLGGFAMVMGLGGSAVAWHLAAQVWSITPWVSRGLAVLGLVAFLVVGAGYLAKAVRYPAVVRAEWAHPVKSAFTATVAVSLLVLSIAVAGWLPGLSQVLFWIGGAGQAVITVMVLRNWIQNATVQPGHIHPAWFIPVVGNHVAPIAGVDYAPEVIVWYFFGVGLVYWLGLLPVVLTRLFTVGTLPARLAPTLAILVAPPAVAALAWNRLEGTWTDPLSLILLGVMTMQLLLLAVQADTLRRMPFAISVWAYTFPLAAAASAYLASTVHGGVDYRWVGAALLAVTTAVVIGVGVRTGIGVRRGEICVKEG